MYLAREGEREREREKARHGVQWRVCEVNTFRNRVEKGGCVVEKVRDRNMERKNGCVLETDSFLRWLGEEDWPIQEVCSVCAQGVLKTTFECR